MPELQRLILFAGAGIGSFALLLLIISVATPAWLSDGSGNTIGLFRKCIASSNASGSGLAQGCFNENRVTQGGLSIFGLLLLVFAIFATIAGAFTENSMVLLVSLGLMFFSSMFVMSAYATWGAYSRDPYSYNFPVPAPSDAHTSMGYSYNLCVASHFFLWTALTLVAFGVGYIWGTGRNATA
jgi:hypothetical protein